MAKLVEILARDLERWPEGVRRIGQDNHGITLFEPQPPRILAELVSEIADDSHTAIVTRAEWQAAVDALKADDCAHSYGSEDGCPECGATKPYSSLNDQEISRVTRSAAWDGVGLPPVGIECEINHVGEVDSKGRHWKRVFILAHHADERLQNPVAIYMPLDGTAHCDQAISICFRPIRTPEQIAAEAREKAIMEMVKIARSVNGGYSAEASALYDAGYRKQEPK